MRKTDRWEGFKGRREGDSRSSSCSSKEKDTQRRGSLIAFFPMTLMPDGWGQPWVCELDDMGVVRLWKSVPVTIETCPCTGDLKSEGGRYPWARGVGYSWAGEDGWGAWGGSRRAESSCPPWPSLSVESGSGSIKSLARLVLKLSVESCKDGGNVFGSFLPN